MREEGAVAVAEVEAPDLEVLVGGAADEEAGVGGDVHAQHRQLVPVQRQEELQAVQEVHLHAPASPPSSLAALRGAPLTLMHTSRLQTCLRAPILQWPGWTGVVSERITSVKPCNVGRGRVDENFGGVLLLPSST